MFQSFSIELQHHLIFSVFESLAWLICTGTQPFWFRQHLILLRCQHKPHFCPCPFIEKNCFLCFVLTLIFICLLWFVPVHTKFFPLSIHRKKLSLVICANSPFPFVYCGLCLPKASFYLCRCFGIGSCGLWCVWMHGWRGLLMLTWLYWENGWVMCSAYDDWVPSENEGLRLSRIHIACL